MRILRLQPPRLSFLLYCLTPLLWGCAGEQAEAGQPVPDASEAVAIESAAGPSDPIASYLTRPVPDSLEVEEAFEALEEGLEAWVDGDHLEGTRMVDAALARLPALEDWRPLVRAELLAETGDTAGVRAALQEVEPATGLASIWGWDFLVRAHEESEDSEGARRVAEAAARDGVGAGNGAAAWLRAGRLALADDDTIAARAALEGAIRAAPEGAHARSAARLFDRISEVTTPAQRLEVGQALLAAGSWERAREHLEPLIADGGLDEGVEARIRLGLGRGLVALDDLEAAGRLLAPLTGEAVPAEIAASAHHWRGRAALGRDDPGAARDHFLAAARRAPSSPVAEEGLLLLLDHVSGRGPVSTEGVMEALLAVGVGSAPGELAAVRFGTQKYLAGEYDAAADAFERYLASGRRRIARQQAAYWAALAHERRGEEDRARALLLASWEEDPLSFYGTFAADRLDTPVLPADLPAGPSSVEGISTELDNATIRLRVHQRVPTSGSFNHELERLQAHFFERGAAAYDFADALLERGFPVQSVVLGRAIHGREGEWNLRLLRIVYPFPYREAVVREAQARGLDPFFVAGLIRQESMFHASIRSSAGAVGLMQLLPSTAREVARAEGIRFSPAALADPDVNLRLGTAFLATMVQRFDGRAEDALSAYNAGPTRARRWQANDEYRDTDVFLEHIPFRETRHYVKVVQQNTRIYTALYGCGDFAPCAGLSYRAAVERSTLAGGAPSSSLAR